MTVPADSPASSSIARPERPRSVAWVAGFWGALSIAGLVTGAIELLELLRTIGGAESGDLNFGLSLGGSASGWLMWRSLLRGRRRAWRLIRRTSLLIVPLLLLGIGVLAWADPSTVTLSGPTGEVPLDPAWRNGVIALLAAGAALFGIQGWTLSRAEVRRWVEAREQEEAAAAPLA